MTRKFKKAVRNVVFDGVITPKEQELLDQIAKQEMLAEIEAKIYTTRKLKERKIVLERGGTWLARNGAVIISGVVTLGGIVLKAVLDGKGKTKNR